MVNLYQYNTQIMRITTIALFLISVFSIDSTLGQDSDIEHTTIKEAIVD